MPKSAWNDDCLSWLLADVIVRRARDGDPWPISSRFGAGMLPEEPPLQGGTVGGATCPLLIHMCPCDVVTLIQVGQDGEIGGFESIANAAV